MKLKNKIKVALNLRGPWEVRRTIWPFKEGWGIYNPRTRMILETGLPHREQAQQIADAENERWRSEQ